MIRAPKDEWRAWPRRLSFLAVGSAGGRPRLCDSQSFCKKILLLSKNQPAVSGELGRLGLGCERGWCRGLRRRPPPCRPAAEEDNGEGGATADDNPQRCALAPPAIAAPGRPPPARRPSPSLAPRPLGAQRRASKVHSTTPHPSSAPDFCHGRCLLPI